MKVTKVFIVQRFERRPGLFWGLSCNVGAAFSGMVASSGSELELLGLKLAHVGDSSVTGSCFTYYTTTTTMLTPSVSLRFSYSFEKQSYRDREGEKESDDLAFAGSFASG